jgi:hypothetical protein
MQLKIKRSQRDGGLVSKNVVFCLDARVEFTPEELRSLTRYKLHKQVIYNSEASQKHLAKAGMSMATGNALGSVKALGSLAFAAMNLNISISSLQKGQHIECKSMDELLQAEDAILTACQNLKAYLETAATFDGREILVDFSHQEPAVVAQAVTPEPKLIAPPRSSDEAESAFAPASSGGGEPIEEPQETSFSEAVQHLWNAIWHRGNPRRYAAVAALVVLLIFLSRA